MLEAAVVIASSAFLGLVGYAALRLERVREAGESGAALEVLEQLVLPVVQEIAEDATLVLKASAADGKLTQAEAKAALNSAVRATLADLPAWAEVALTQTAGSQGAMVERVVVPQVEKAVAEVKTRLELPNLEQAAKDELRKMARARLGL